MSVNDADVVSGDYYWAWVDVRDRHAPDALPQLMIVQPWRERSAEGQPGPAGRIWWEGCGTDEGVHVIDVVSRAHPPAAERPVLAPVRGGGMLP